MRNFEVMRRKLEELFAEIGRPITLMEVCGTHTVSVFRSGLRSLLPEGLRLLSGPGCPVCVTDQREIDMALSLAGENRIITTYGDMMRVPGSNSSSAANSLAKIKSGGARVEVVTSAMQSIDIAKNNPDSEVVFLGVGFETTAPSTAIAIKQASALGLRNFSVLCLHKTVPPALKALCPDSKSSSELKSNPEFKIDGFILPGNVTVVTGVRDYEFLTSELRKAAAVAGFEPEEILAAIVGLSRQIAGQNFSLEIYRANDVPKDGNPAARKILSEVFETKDAAWRGLGRITNSGLRISENYARFDAAEKFGLTTMVFSVAEANFCRCGEVLSGLLTPPECELFGTACTPLSPVGPCMVSNEGTCGAWHKFNRRMT